MSIVVKKHRASISQRFSPIPACFRRPPASTTAAGDPPSTTTSVYATDFGPCVLTWTRTLHGRTLRIQFDSNSIDLTLKIRSKPLLFWRNHGSKTSPSHYKTQTQVLYDFRRCRFGSEAEPDSGFYLLILVAGEIALLIGDLVKSAYSKIKHGSEKDLKLNQRLVSRKENVYGSRFYRAAAVVNGKKMRFLIEHDCSETDPVLRISVNGFRVLEIEHLMWKFRGNEQIKVGETLISVSWDVHGWLFKSKKKEENSGSAVFMFNFENEKGQCREMEDLREKIMMVMTTSAASSISSLSGSSWGSSSSVRDWWSAEEREMEGNGGFSLVVYAWKSSE